MENQKEQIDIVWGSSGGPTHISAFDSALKNAGIHNYNIIPVSSVIPDGSEPVEIGTHEQEWPSGQTVAAVVAEKSSSTTGDSLAAGVAWKRAEQGGIFCEATGEKADNVKKELKTSVQHCKNLRESWDWEEKVGMRIVEEKVTENNASALVAALIKPV